ncbi:MAG: ROK family protein [Mycobacteriaceae bacterium]
MTRVVGQGRHDGGGSSRRCSCAGAAAPVTRAGIVSVPGRAGRVIAGIETGGTKVVCGVAKRSAPHEIVSSRRFPTSTPEVTIAEINAFLSEAALGEPVDALGIGTFGPVNVVAELPRYGWITGTPKPGWADTDLLGGIDLAAQVPTALLSDVSGAALGEQRRGAGVGVASIGYATFGTGVGVGLVVQGQVLHGNGYPELGHLLVRRHPLDDFVGCCPLHGDCAEGLASGPAVLARWGASSSSLPARTRPRAFEILGFYVAQVAAAAAYAAGSERVVLGGGVLKAPGLFEAANQQLPIVTGGPGAGHAAALDAPDFLRRPVLGELSGLLGAIAAAADLLPARSPHRAS